MNWYHNWYHWDGKDLLLNLLVQPRATKDELVAIQGDVFKVRITAPPVDGRANEQLIRFLARSFGVKSAQVQIIYGNNGRRKVVRINDPILLPVPVQRLNITKLQ